MANWKEITERWLPIVEKMEDEGMEDYAIPEIYRAAENEICRMIDDVDAAIKGRYDDGNKKENIND